MPTLTVRAKATVLATLLCAAVLAVAGVLVVQTLDRHLTDSSDELSRSRVARPARPGRHR